MLDRPNEACRWLFRNILNEIKIQPSQVLFFDDRLVNVESAQEVGLNAAVFTLEAGLTSYIKYWGSSGFMPHSKSH